MRFGKFTKMALAVAAAVLFAGVGVRAQEDVGGPGPEAVRIKAGMPLEDIGFLGFEAGIGGKTVTGAPFSATISTQSTQVLADGNQIQRSTNGTIARDSQGRTRRDVTLPTVGPLAEVVGKTPPHAVFINDPVAGTSYILHADKKTADQLPGHVLKMAKGMLEQESGRLEHEGRRVENNERTTADLGTQNINGVSAQGTRVTRTIPAGEIGNTKPIVITTERWYSPDLQTYVMIKRSDPMMGDSVFQLTNIQRVEPEASLFQVPADYTVTQRGPRGAGKAGMPAPAPQPEQ